MIQRSQRTDHVTASRCPVCGSGTNRREFEARDPHYGNSGSWNVHRCSGCQSTFIDPFPSSDDLLAFYPEESYYAFQLQPRSAFRDRWRRLLGFRLGTREPAFERPGTLLDFGCGAGDFLLQMRRIGWNCYGVEVNRRAVEKAREMGLDVRTALSGNEGFADESFDYVRANHALEHVTDPADTLKQMFRVLRPGGTLFLGVPTNDGINARVFGPHWWYLGVPVHPVTFSTRALVDLVGRTGFHVTRVTTNSDFGGTTGSLQIFLNRHSLRRSSEGLVYGFRPFLLLGHWAAKLQDALGMGDKLELVAIKPVR